MIEKKLIAENDETVWYDVTGYSDIAIVNAQEIAQREHGMKFNLVEEGEKHNSEVLILPISFDNYSPIKAGFNIKMFTPELTDDKLVQVNRLKGTNGILLYRSSEHFNPEDLKAIESADMEKMGHPKSLNERIRNTIYKLWIQSEPNYHLLDESEKRERFGQFYRVEKEKELDRFKSRLA